MTQINSKTIIQLIILLSAFTILFGQTIVKMAHDWMSNDNYSHGFLIPLIAGYMIWKKKKEFSTLSINSFNPGLILIFFGMSLFLLGNIGAELFITRTAMVVTIVGICLYYLGQKMTIKITVPLAYLMFMIPLPSLIWNKIAFPLQLFATNLTAVVVHIFGIPILREGNILYLTNTTLEVVDACSGLRSLSSLLALSGAFAYISDVNIFNKWILFLSAIPIAVLLNIVRLTFTVFMAKYLGPDAAHGFLHEFSGILVFIMAFVLLFVLYFALRSIQRIE